MRQVAAIVEDGAEPFGLGALCEVWDEPHHPEDGTPVFDFRIVTPQPGRVPGASGFDLHVDRGLEDAADADLVCVVPKRRFWEPSPAVSEVLRAAHDRGATLLAHCTGTFTLGQAGLLDGVRCTTHWRHVDTLVTQHPEALVDPNVLYVHDGPIVTGAGSAAGLDACLHLMRETFGAQTAAATARRMVVPPHRDGGQAQFIARPVATCDTETFGPLLEWVINHLDEPLEIAGLARRANMSARTFARRFRAETGATPHSWITRQRVMRAEELLERSDASIEQIAAQVGFGNAANLRHHFARARGVSPQAYRTQFAS